MSNDIFYNPDHEEPVVVDPTPKPVKEESKEIFSDDVDKNHRTTD